MTWLDPQATLTRVRSSHELRRVEKLLGRRDPVLRRVIKGVGPCKLDVMSGTSFQILTGTIISQQLCTIVAMIIYGRLVEKGQMTGAEADANVARITPTLELAGLGPLDLIIECATENEAVKHKIFAALAPHLGEHTILTSNTSSISITRLASATDRPERFMGFHFMNPVPVMELVELIRGIATDDATFQTMKEVVAKLGKTATNSEDFPAFIVNRILLPMINEAIYTLYEGVGSVQGIDTAMKLGTRHPMGPL